MTSFEPLNIILSSIYKPSIELSVITSHMTGTNASRDISCLSFHNQNEAYNVFVI